MREKVGALFGKRVFHGCLTKAHGDRAERPVAVKEAEALILRDPVAYRFDALG